MTGSRAGRPQSRAVIVHPRFAHTLTDLPVASAVPVTDWHSLPFELLEAIAAQLEKAQDLVALSSVCRDSRRLVSSPALWRQLCRRRFGVPVPEELGLEKDPSAACPGFWLELFKYNHRVFNDLLRSTQRPGGMRFDALRFAQAPLLVQLQ